MTRLASTKVQLFIGVFVLCLGVFTAWASWQSERRDNAQNECFHRSFQTLTEILEKRGSLAQRETQADRKLNLAELTVKSDEEYLKELREYEAELRAIEQEREENPIPPYPEGTCGDDRY